MPTLRFRRFDEIPPEDQEHVAFLRARMRGREDIDRIWGAHAHWLEALHLSLRSPRRQTLAPVDPR